MISQTPAMQEKTQKLQLPKKNKAKWIIELVRQFTRALFLFFPAILFLLLAWFAFWKITQGRDLMFITLEKPRIFIIFFVVLLFWCYASWYTSRIVGKAKNLQQSDPNDIFTRLRVQMPRVIAFSCITLLILAFLQIPYNRTPLQSSIAHILFLLSIPYYILLFRWFDHLTAKERPGGEKWLKSAGTIAWLSLITAILLAVIIKMTWSLVMAMLVIQVVLVFQLVARRKLLEIKDRSYWQKSNDQRGYDASSPLLTRLKGLLLDEEDRLYFRIYAGITLLALAIFLYAVFSVSFAILLGSFPLVLLAFGMLLSIGNFLAFFSVLLRFNLHVPLILIALILGRRFELHYTRLLPETKENTSFQNRPNLKEFFYNWINDSVPQGNLPSRHSILLNDSTSEYPVYFVLANGGASRSGYWVASVLSRIHDETGGRFASHLFCLSGASGGSLGNAAYFSLLRTRHDSATNGRFMQYSRDYLKNDFLTYTLARMLGPDILHHIVPVRGWYNRADALAQALERSPGNENFLYDSLARGFSHFIPQAGHAHNGLPILAINTTRMQDGYPGVISSIRIKDDPAFNNRVDVLDLLLKGKDLKLSSAVVLGASFPYVSPAGRIDTRKTDSSEIKPHYFVDGGYFDNSGAGFVNEMIIALKSYIRAEKDPLTRKKMEKLKFHVLHVTNDPVGYDPLFKKVNPVMNDLAAPLQTLIGAYGSQTSINDLRLAGFLRADTILKGSYRTFPLYRYQDDSITYSMNWVISEYLLRAMDTRVGEEEITRELDRIKEEIRMGRQ